MVSADVNVQADLYRKVPCNFAGMDEGCLYHKEVLESSEWVAPKFNVHIGPGAGYEPHENAEQELQDESTHVAGWFRKEVTVIPEWMVVEGKRMLTQQWINELEEDISGYLEGNTKCMAMNA